MLISLDQMIPILRCPISGSELKRSGDFLTTSDQQKFPIIEGIPVFVGGESLRDLPKSYKKRENQFRRRLHRLFLVRVSRESTAAINNTIEGAISQPCCRILIVGGGTVSGPLREALTSPTHQVASLDVYASETTNLVADGHNIPFADETFDFAFVQAVLEHVLSPSQVVKEIHRVLRPPGIVVADTPFLYPVHEGAYDFTRFTHNGHRWLFRSFEEIASGPSIGAGTAFMVSAKYFFGALTRNRVLIALLLAPFLLARLCDRLISRDKHIDAGGGFYFIGAKSLKDLSPDEVLRYYCGAQR